MRESDAAHLTEEGDPSQNLRAFRRALGQFATGVTIITACVGDRLAGDDVEAVVGVIRRCSLRTGKPSSTQG